MDRFGRIVDQRWRAGSVDKDRNKYTYDRDGNRLTKGNPVNSVFNEVYTYDGLNQLSSSNRGIGARTQSFDYDALGNRDGVTTNGMTQTYTSNKQNEITSISGATTPTYDANGNMTGDETGKTFFYDAWNRTVAVKSGATVLKSYVYDGMNRRIAETASGVTTDLYYSAGWQVLEERVGGVTRVSNVWSPVYVDAMVARDRDTDANGSLDERLYVTHDANFNVTGLVNTSGAVVERYVYDSYGAVTVLNASWTVLGGSAYAWVYLHQGGRVDGVSGLVHFRNRDYSTGLGRWTTVDPVRYQARDSNLYRAFSNSPTCLVDPLGEMGIGEIGDIGDYNDVVYAIRVKMGEHSMFGLLNFGAFVRSVGGKFSSSTTEKGTLSPRYLMTCKCGLIDFKHFFQLAYLAYITGPETATHFGYLYELRDEPSSRFMPEDLMSNALGTFFGAVVLGSSNWRPRTTNFMVKLKDLIQRCVPVPWSEMEASDKEKVLDYYAYERHLGLNAKPRVDSQVGTSLTCKLNACKAHPQNTTFPFAISGDGFRTTGYAK